MEFHRSAFKHELAEDAIRHAIDAAVLVVDLEPDADPPRVLAIGLDPDGRWLEVIWLELPDRDLVIHAMRLRKAFFALLPGGGDQ